MEKGNSWVTGSVWAGAGKEVLSERLVAYGPNSKAIAGVGFGGLVTAHYLLAARSADPQKSDHKAPRNCDETWSPMAPPKAGKP